MSNGNDDSQPSPTDKLERLRRNLFGNWRFSSREGSSGTGSSRAPASSPSITSGRLTGSQSSPTTPVTETSEIEGRILEEDEHHDDEHHEDEQHDDEQHIEDEGGNQYVYLDSDDEIVITCAGAAQITPRFSLRTDPAGKSWGDVSEPYRDFYYREFKKRVKWSPTIEEGRMREAFYNQRTDGQLKKKMVEAETLKALHEGWNGLEFQDTSKRKKKNRRKGKEDGPALGTYTGGTVSFSENSNRLAAKKRMPASLEDGIIHTKTKKHDGQSWVDPVNADLWARFNTLRDEANKNGLNCTDQEIWYSLVQGHNAKNCVQGVGDYERKMRKLKASSTNRRSTSSGTSKTEIESLKEHNKRLQEQVDALTSKFTSIQEDLKKLYGNNYRPRDDEGTGGGAGQAIC